MSSVDFMTNKREQVVEIVRRWGDASSDAILDQHCEFFLLPGIDGLISYRREGQCAIVFGDPVCPPDDVKKMILAFHHFCDNQGWNVIYVTVSETFALWCRENFQGLLIECGEELYMNPAEDPKKKTGNNASLVRRKERHAKKEGVAIHEYLSEDLEIEKKIEAVADEWLKGRKGPQVYISHVRLFEDRLGKRWFYAESQGKVVGVIVANQLQKFHGWLINRLMITKDAPHGTPEMLLLHTLERLAQEGYEFVTFGTIQREKLGKIEGFSTLTSNLFRYGFQIVVKVLHLEGRRKFWEKFDPKSRGTFLVIKNPNVGIKELKAIMKALNISF